MFIGKLISDLTIGSYNGVEDEIGLDITGGTLPTSFTGLTRIGDELLYYGDLKLVSDTEIKLLRVQRSYYYTESDTHKRGSLVYSLSQDIKQTNNSANLYDIGLLTSSPELQLNSSNNNFIKIDGDDYLLQEARLVMTNIGNSILGHLEFSDVDKDTLTSRYQESLSQISTSINGVEVTSLEKDQDNNRLNIVVSAIINGKTYSNIYFSIRSKSTL